MNVLQPLRRQLTSASWRRLLLNCLIAALRFVPEIIVALAILFTIDFWFDLRQSARCWLLLLATGVLLWRLYVKARPLLRRENILDLALLLEKQHQSPGTLVAGLQFAQQGATSGGSRQLAARVMHEAAERADELDWSVVFPTKECRREALEAGRWLLAVVAVAFVFPAHFQNFVRHLMLHDMPYPTRTHVGAVLINGRHDFEHSRARVVEGAAVTLTVETYGRLPESGAVRIASLNGDDTTSIVLERIASRTPAKYEAHISKLDESVRLEVKLGDARVAPLWIDIIRYPTVELEIGATPPAYARPKLDARVGNERYANYLRGSTLTFDLKSTNKPLASAELNWSNDTSEGSVLFEPTNAARTEWSVSPVGAPLASLTSALEFDVVVTDEDGLTTRQPIRGKVGVIPDQTPIGSLRTDHHLVLPDASPEIHFQASDDFGISQLAVEVLRDRNGDVTAERTIELAGELRKQQADRTNLAGDVTVELSEVDLRDGDRVLVRLKATDERGGFPSETVTSEPVEIEIGNKARVLRSILEADAAAERLLTEAIERETDRRDEP